MPSRLPDGKKAEKSETLVPSSWGNSRVFRARLLLVEGTLLVVFCRELSNGLTLPLLLELEDGCIGAGGEALLELLTFDTLVGGSGSFPNLGKSNWKFTSLGLLTPLFPRPCPARYGGRPLRLSGGERPLIPGNNLFLYSRSSTDIFSI
jgi:hypothetical protein